MGMFYDICRCKRYLLRNVRSKLTSYSTKLFLSLGHKTVSLNSVHWIAWCNMIEIEIDIGLILAVCTVKSIPNSVINFQPIVI